MLPDLMNAGLETAVDLFFVKTQDKSAEQTFVGLRDQPDLRPGLESRGKGGGGRKLFRENGFEFFQEFPGKRHGRKHFDLLDPLISFEAFVKKRLDVGQKRKPLFRDQHF